MSKVALFHFYGSLKDFIKKEDVNYAFTGTPTVKDAIEAIGVPHPEVKCIVVNGGPVDFSHKLQENEKIDVLSQTLNDFNHLPIKFFLDVHLGKLARELRMLGFDSLYENTYKDEQIAQIAADDDRIVLTRDVGLLKIGKIQRGYWLRSKSATARSDKAFSAF